MLFSGFESFQINITFIRSAVPATDDTCSNQNCIAFLPAVPAFLCFLHFSTFFSVTVHRSSESTFPPGPNGLGSPLNVVDALLSTAAVTIQLFNGTRCKLLKSIFHLHTLVRTSLSAECSTERARWARNFRTVQRSAENCY